MPCSQGCWPRKGGEGLLSPSRARQAVPAGRSEIATLTAELRLRGETYVSASEPYPFGRSDVPTERSTEVLLD